MNYGLANYIEPVGLALNKADLIANKIIMNGPIGIQM